MNVLLVSATVTTSTIEALPIITPSDVRMAPSLFARIACLHRLPSFRYHQQPLRLAALYGVVPNVVDQLRRFWMALQRFCKFLVRHGEIFLLPSAISRREMPFGGVQLRQLLDLRQR